MITPEQTKLPPQEWKSAPGFKGALAVLAVILIALCWLAFTDGFIGPPSLLMAASVIILYEFTGPISRAIGACWLPLGFTIWCLSLPQDPLPVRSLVLLVGSVAASLFCIAFDYRLGIGSHGTDYVWTGIALNTVGLGLVMAMLFAVKRSRSLKWSLAFHFTLFAWLAWPAFPWLGEFP